MGSQKQSNRGSRVSRSPRSPRRAAAMRMSKDSGINHSEHKHSGHRKTAEKQQHGKKTSQRSQAESETLEQSQRQPVTPGTRHIQEPGDYASGSNDKAGVRWGSDLVNTEDR